MRTPRYLKNEILKALQKKMVFLGGPRQVGKTSFSLDLLGRKATEKHPGYMNWDNPQMKKDIQQGKLAPLEKHYSSANVEVLPYIKFCKKLALP
jgi:predicted AAA+ superfamily ATPase